MTIRQNSFIAGEMISRKQLDQMGLPIGNPILPPFNRKEMPFAPIAGAFAAVGTAAATGGVLATTLAVVNLAAVAAMYVGVAMTVTGMITGDKDLMKLGAIVGLAGGVGSMAIGGVASLAAGGQFAMGTAGINSMNAANAASAASAANIGVTGTLGSIAPSTVNPATTMAQTGQTVAAEAGKTSAQTAALFINQCNSNEATIRFKSTHNANSDYRVGASILVNSAFEIYHVN
jgi:hypothetical protein